MAAIEPISSAMTYQAQPVQSAQVARESAPQTEKSAEEFTESSTANAAASIDNKTIVVDSATKAENGEENESGQPNQNAEASQKQIRKAIENLNKKMDSSNSEMQFGIHEGTQRITIKVIDKDTKKVIKEFPPEKTLDMIAKVWEMAGIMVDEKR